jgi:hypothetical protein
MDFHRHLHLTPHGFIGGEGGYSTMPRRRLSMEILFNGMIIEQQAYIEY